ncbi:acyl-CoA/acyl-ACP dehydrogenase [Bradyrhizobium sp. 183]|uniref:acyl-CoA dehydrogenase family protein n=1 Tax=unclassified Bradyrhizobium TaxID=2631580 RepID=UPI001FFFB490|nr:MULTISPECIES: acyl-CoA dehydrogenase family protein [unclassified Bradyrhizobium]UPJ79351.1 acyl-CoA/acyl-ACP dehydrogenase [Bradyrhizobium sp. 184]UPJ87145.1 acyl-CoA/acyl-ACP dehydrogenase [Bradyrhizobium sp. 183]
MDTTLTEEETMVRESARGFLETNCPTSLVRAMEKDPKGYPPALWQEAVALGWAGMCLPEAYGGSGLPVVYLGLVLEEIGRAVAPLPLLSTSIAALAIADVGSDAVKSAVLPGVASGKTLLSWAFSEQNPSFELASVQTSARDDGELFVVNGTKMFVENFGSSQHCLVAVRTALGAAKNEGLSLLLIDTSSAGITETPLVTMAKDKMSAVTFADVRVPKANLIGELNAAGPAIERMLERGTALLCAQMLGATRKDMEMAVEWAKYRRAFGQPIGAFQSIQHMCADMLMWIDGGNLLTYEALWRMDQGLPASVESSQAKAFCNEKCQAVVRQSQVIHGGIGFMMEFDLQLWYRRVCAWTMRLGTAYEHRAKIAHALIDLPGKVILGRPVPVIPEAV